MKEKELIIRAVEVDGEVRVEMNGIANDKTLTLILHDIIELLYNRIAKHVATVRKE